MVEGPGTTRNSVKVSKVLNHTVSQLSIHHSSSTTTNTNSTTIRNNTTSSTHSSIDGKSKPWWEGRYLSQVIKIGKELFLIFSLVEHCPNDKEHLHYDNDDDDNVSSNFNSRCGEVKELALRLHFGMNGSLVVHNNKNVDTLSNSNSIGMSYRHSTHESHQHQTPQVKNVSKNVPTLQIIFGSEISTTSSNSVTTQNSSNCKQQQISNQSYYTIVETFQTTITGPISSSIPKAKYSNLHTHDVCNTSFDEQMVLSKIYTKYTNTNATSDDNTRMNYAAETITISDVLLDQSILPGVGNIIKIESLHQCKLHPKTKMNYLLSSSSSSNLSTFSTTTTSTSPTSTTPSGEELLYKIINKCHFYAMEWLRLGYAPNKCVYNRTVCGTCHQNTICMHRVGGDSRNSLSRVTFWCSSCQPLHSLVTERGEEEQSKCTNSMSLLESNHQKLLSSTSSSFQNNNHINIPAPDTSSKLVVVGTCPKHGADYIKLLRVRNTSSANLHRLFRTCSKCNHFKWVDLHFPSCHCKKRCIIRISKTERSGGRWFFACSSGSSSNGRLKQDYQKSSKHNNGCSYFAWAEMDHLEKLGSQLTPLL